MSLKTTKSRVSPLEVIRKNQVWSFVGFFYLFHIGYLIMAFLLSIFLPFFYFIEAGRVAWLPIMYVSITYNFIIYFLYALIGILGCPLFLYKVTNTRSMRSPTSSAIIYIICEFLVLGSVFLTFICATTVQQLNLEQFTFPSFDFGNAYINAVFSQTLAVAIFWTLVVGVACFLLTMLNGKVTEASLESIINSISNKNNIAQSVKNSVLNPYEWIFIFGLVYIGLYGFLFLVYQDFLINPSSYFSDKIIYTYGEGYYFVLSKSHAALSLFIGVFCILLPCIGLIARYLKDRGLSGHSFVSILIHEIIAVIVLFVLRNRKKLLGLVSRETD
ncbi:MAG: hypothetical protein ACFFBD_05110, partial [Candidatus Hodarchaeota archaeon]